MPVSGHLCCLSDMSLRIYGQCNDAAAYKVQVSIPRERDFVLYLCARHIPKAAAIARATAARKLGTESIKPVAIRIHKLVSRKALGAGGA